MTDTRPKTGTQASAGPNDDPQDYDSLRSQARRETSKAEGEDPGEGRGPTITPPIANPD